MINNLQHAELTNTIDVYGINIGMHEQVKLVMFYTMPTISYGPCFPMYFFE